MCGPITVWSLLGLRVAPPVYAGMADAQATGHFGLAQPFAQQPHTLKTPPFQGVKIPPCSSWISHAGIVAREPPRVALYHANLRKINGLGIIQPTHPFKEVPLRMEKAGIRGKLCLGRNCRVVRRLT